MKKILFTPLILSSLLFSAGSYYKPTKPVYPIKATKPTLSVKASKPIQPKNNVKKKRVKRSLKKGSKRNLNMMNN